MSLWRLLVAWGSNPFSINIFVLCAGTFVVGGLTAALFIENALHAGWSMLILLLGIAFMYLPYRAIRVICNEVAFHYHEDWMRKHMVHGARIRKIDKDNRLLDEFVVSREEEPPRTLWN